MTPTFDKYMEWGYIDGSIRFYMADSKKVGGYFSMMRLQRLIRIS